MTVRFFASDDYEIVLGDNFFADYQYSNEAGAINITGYTITFTIYSGFQSVLVVSGSITDAANGKFKVELSQAQTTALGRGEFNYELKLVDATNIKITRLKGNFTVI